ncbi:UBL3-like, ubiquitin domain [Dillenia turbinata]|uniref:UBL3-like, ubiquitin domain n=1 Tax=Dillenia turbinata TaxID=194707 RepID=A0AAN8Z8D0_9MAGN
MPEEDLVELKFRLADGSDIGPFRYSPTSTVAMVKERIVSEWPKGTHTDVCGRSQLEPHGEITPPAASSVPLPPSRLMLAYSPELKLQEHKRNAPKAANDIKLISAGKILENNKTVGQCRVPFGELPRGVITMHVVVQPSLTKAKTEKKIDDSPKKNVCSCSIL